MSGGSRCHGVPRVPPHVLARPRLTDALDAAGALTVVRGPAGSGKTVLLADWVRRRRPGAAPAVWVTLDEASVTRRAFWARLDLALTDAGVIPGDLPVRDELAAAGAVVVVVDGYHLMGDRRLDEEIVEALDDCPGVRMVVATREPSALEMRRMPRRLDPVVVTPGRLRFDEAELIAALQEAGLPQGVETPQGLLAKIGGLPLVVGLVSEAVRRHAGEQDLHALDQVLRTTVVRFFREVVLPATDPRLTPFLLATCVADALTPGLAETLGGRADAADCLDRAEDAGYGHWQRDGDDRPVFRYTLLARTALRAELAERDPAAHQGLRRRLAVWAESHGRPDIAFREALSAGDLGLAARVVRASWPTLLRDHGQEVGELLGGLTLRQQLDHPELTLALALAYNARMLYRARAMELFGVAVTAAQTTTAESRPDRLVLRSVESVALRLSGQPGLALAATEDALALVEGLTAEDRAAMDRQLPALLNQHGIVLLCSGRFGRALALFSRAAALDPGADGRERFFSLGLAAGASAIAGDMIGAAHFVALAHAVPCPPEWREGRHGVMCHLAETYLHLDRLEFDEADTHLAAVEPYLATLEFWPSFAYARAMADLGRGRALPGAERLAEQLGPAGHLGLSDADRRNLTVVQALLLGAAGKTARGTALLGSGSGRRSDPWPRLARAADCLRTGRPERAARQLRGMAGEGWESLRWRGTFHLVRAAVAQHCGRAAEAAAALDAAAAVLVPHGRLLPVMLLRREDRETLAALAGARGSAAARELFRRAARVPVALPSAPETVVLTSREEAVLHALCRLPGSREIASALGVSANTVKTQLRSLYRKLGADSRAEALSRGRLLGVFGA